MTAPTPDGLELVTVMPALHGLAVLLYRRAPVIDPWDIEDPDPPAWAQDEL